MMNPIKRQEAELKVYSFARPHIQTFSSDQFDTVGKFQGAVEQWFGIPLEQQKLLRDDKIVSYWKTAPFSQLKLTPATRLTVLTTDGRSIRRKKVEKEKVERNSLEGKMNGSLSAGVNLSGKKSEEVGSKVVNCLKDQAIKKLVAEFIKAIKIPRAELLLLDEGKLKFVLHKVAADNSLLLNLLLGNIQTVRQALIDQSKLQIRPAESTAPASAVTYLMRLNYAEADAVRALEMSRNNVFGALSILCGGKPQEGVAFKLRKDRAIQEYRSISQWLQINDNKPIILYLKHTPEDLEIFINYWKHTNPQLYEIMLKWRLFINDLINYHYNKIKP